MVTVYRTSDCFTLVTWLKTVDLGALPQPDYCQTICEQTNVKMLHSVSRVVARVEIGWSLLFLGILVT